MTPACSSIALTGLNLLVVGGLPLFGDRDPLPLGRTPPPRSPYAGIRGDPPQELTVYDEERYIYHDLLARKWWGHFDFCNDSFVYDYVTE